MGCAVNIVRAVRRLWDASVAVHAPGARTSEIIFTVAALVKLADLTAARPASLAAAMQWTGGRVHVLGKAGDGF